MPSSTILSLQRKRGGALEPLFAAPTFARQNTTFTNALGADGYSWAQGFPVLVDAFGNIILSAEDTSGNHRFVYSVDNGATWVDNTGATGNGGTGSTEGFILRSALAYNDVDDVLWALHSTTNGGDGGAFLRRYTFTRDGSNKITSIIRDQSASCVFEDDASAHSEKPTLLWLNDGIYGGHGALLASWQMVDAAHSEGHATIRVLTNTGADLVATNWRTLAGGTSSDTSTVVTTKSAPISVITPAYTSSMCLSTLRKRSGTHAKDFYVFWQDAATSGAVRASRLTWNAGTGWFSAGIAPVALSNNVRAGSTTIRQLWEVMSKPTEDTLHDTVYIGFANWKDNANGDTWSVAGLSNSDTAVAIADAYSCGGTFTPSLYALTGDIAFDTTTQRLVVTYIHSGGVSNNGGYARTFNGTTYGAEATLFTSADVDIPLLYANPRTGATRINGSLFFVFRDTRNQSAPYFGWSGKVNLS
jgi:hypothetical protein